MPKEKIKNSKETVQIKETLTEQVQTEEVKEQAQTDKAATEKDIQVISGEEVFGTALANTDGSMLLMQGQNGGSFNVKFIFDCSKGAGHLLLIICYPTGTAQSILLAQNICRPASYEDNGIADKEQYQGSIKLPSIKPRPVETRHSVNDDWVRPYERPDMPIPLSEIWNRIIDRFSEIPIVEINKCGSLAELYAELIDLGETKAEKDSSLSNRDYVLLTKDEICETAESYGMKFNDVRNEFAVRGLWECDANSGGYQKSKKLGNGKTMRFYALKKRISVSVGSEEPPNEDTKYFDSRRPVEDEKDKKISDLSCELEKEKKESFDLREFIRARIEDLTQEEMRRYLW